jgi:dTDP-glucose 4,6-dehydratase
MPRALVTGGAGFIGAHLCRTLRDRGWDVVAVDDLSTGTVDHVADLIAAGGGFTFVRHDVCDGIPVEGPFDAVLHFASAASPPEYLSRPFETLAVGSTGTRHALDLAHTSGARFLLASTSEVYGDPEEHPQSEAYHGNVDPVGPRSVYDEAKRFAEALSMAYARTRGTDVKIARIFNTYGPLLEPADGRVISNFLAQAMRAEPLTVYGDGTQTRSFCYIDDEVSGLLALLESDWVGPMNIGNPDEYTILEVAKLVLEITDSSSEVVFEGLPPDDPVRRCPDISLAERELGWKPVVGLRDGLLRTLEWYRARI